MQSDPITRITMNATPDADATLGRRPLRIQIGDEIIESSQLCRVCSTPECDEIELDQEPLNALSTSSLTVHGAEPGETVRFAASPGGLGTGPCPLSLGGLCLDLGMPALQLGTAIADDLGRAIFTLTAPDQAGTEVGTQAVIERGLGGSESVKSNVVLEEIQP